LSKLERGKLTNMTLELMSRVAGAYQVPLLWMVEFLTGESGSSQEGDAQHDKPASGTMLSQIEAAGPDMHRAIASWLCEHEPELVRTAIRENTSLRRTILLEIAEDLSSQPMAVRDPETEFARRKGDVNRQMANTPWGQDDPES
jgi:hypothetical protein